MKMKKILLVQLPLPVEQALTEHLKARGEFEVISIGKNLSGLAAGNPDLVVTSIAVNMPGCPVLQVSFAQPKRLGTLLRQIGQMLAQPVLYLDDIAIGNYIFRPQERALARNEGEEVALTDREVDILAYLVRHRADPVSREALLKNVWQYQSGVDTHTIETHIYRLRQKIEVSADEPRILLTVDGGYTLNLPETEAK
jgi:DNA-binding winged helix-turn-helix (wHTH) protein